MRRAWTWLGSLSTWAFLGLLALVLVLRSGFGIDIGRGNIEFARSFPTPYPGYQSSAVMGPALGWLLGATTRDRWLALHAVLTVLVLAQVLWMLHRRLRRGDPFRLAALWVSISSIPTVLLQGIGYYDVFTVLGGTLVALGSSPVVAGAGGAVLGATNPEQGSVAILAAGLVGFACRDRSDRAGRDVVARGVASIAGLLVARLGVAVWFAHEQVSIPGRGTLLKGLLIRSVKHSVSWGSLGVYSWFGIAWVLVATICWIQRRDRARLALLLIGLIALPALATVTTVDGTRVFAMTVWPAFLVATVWLMTGIDRVDEVFDLRSVSVGCLALAIVLPAVVTDPAPRIRLPFEYLVNRVVGGPP